MAYGISRFLTNNFITSIDMITAGSQAAGVPSSAERTLGSGVASMYVAGSFSHGDNLDYIAQIDSTTPGSEVGQATFRYKDSDSSTWVASGVTTTATPQSINYGLTVGWISSEGVDFTLDDTFQWFAVAKYGTRNLIDLDPNSLFRSGSTFPIVVDLGSAQNVTVFALYNHNLTAGVSTLTLEGNSSDAWGSPAYSQAVTITDHCTLYLDETYRYWRVVPVDGALSYFQAGGMYLGDYIELARPAWWGSSRTYGLEYAAQKTKAGVYYARSESASQRFSLQYDHVYDTDITILAAMQQALAITQADGRVYPMYLHFFNDDANTFKMVDWINIQEIIQVYKSNEISDSITLEFAEKALV